MPGYRHSLTPTLPTLPVSPSVNPQGQLDEYARLQGQITRGEFKRRESEQARRKTASPPSLDITRMDMMPPRPNGTFKMRLSGKSISRQFLLIFFAPLGRPPPRASSSFEVSLPFLNAPRQDLSRDGYTMYLNFRIPPFIDPLPIFDTSPRKPPLPAPASIRSPLMPTTSSRYPHHLEGDISQPFSMVR